MILNRSDTQQVNRELTDTMYALYLDQLWGQTVGYKPVPYLIVVMNKTLVDWWGDQDCQNQLCLQSQNQSIVVAKYPTWGNSPFPQIQDHNNCCRRNRTGPCAQNCCCQPQEGDVTFFTLGAFGCIE